MSHYIITYSQQIEILYSKVQYIIPSFILSILTKYYIKMCAYMITMSGYKNL